MEGIFNNEQENLKELSENAIVEGMPDKLKTSYKESEFYRKVFESKRRYMELLYEPIDYFYNKQPNLFNINEINLIDKAIRYTEFDKRIHNKNRHLEHDAIQDSPEIR